MNIFVLSVQFEGEDALHAFGDITETLRKALKTLQNNDYTTGISTIKIYIGVAGELGDFDESNGCQRVTVHNSTCIVDIVMHKEVWQHDKTRLISFLYKEVLNATVKLIATLEERSIPVQGELLKNDITKTLTTWKKLYIDNE